MAKLIRDPANSGRILLADDEEMVRKAIRLILSFSGYNITEAVDGEDAVQKYVEATPPFDLVLIDVDMPRLGGEEAVTRMRRHDPQVKAILLSGGLHGTGSEKITFLQKPFDNQQLIGLVRATIEAEARV